MSLHWLSWAHLKRSNYASCRLRHRQSRWGDPVHRWDAPDLPSYRCGPQCYNICWSAFSVGLLEESQVCFKRLFVPLWLWSTVSGNLHMEQDKHMSEASCLKGAIWWPFMWANLIHRCTSTNEQGLFRPYKTSVSLSKAVWSLFRHFLPAPPMTWPEGGSLAIGQSLNATTSLQLCSDGASTTFWKGLQRRHHDNLVGWWCRKLRKIKMPCFSSATWKKIEPI